jgi:hypothetical protein
LGLGHSNRRVHSYHDLGGDALMEGLYFNPAKHLSVWRPTGLLSESDVREVVEEFEIAERDHIFDRRYVDLSRVEQFALSFDFICKLSLHRRMAHSYKGTGVIRSAIYVTTVDGWRIARTHANLTSESPLHVRVFRKERDAAEWLHVTVDDLLVEYHV